MKARLFVLLIGIVWASLLFISWGTGPAGQATAVSRPQAADR